MTGRRWRVLLMAALCAVLTFAHAIRCNDLPLGFVTDKDRNTYLLERHTGFGKAGPVFREQVNREAWAELQQALDNEVTAIPFGIADTVVHNGNGRVMPLRVLDVNARIQELLPEPNTPASSKCDHDRIRFDERLQERLGLVSGQWVKIGDKEALIGTNVSASVLRLLPGIEGAGAIRCVADPFAEKAPPVEQALLLAKREITETALATRLASLIRDDGAFKEEWRLTRLDRAAELAGKRRLGWLLGLECLIAILAVGALVLLRALEEVGRSADIAVRRALGERHRHRIKRHFLAGLSEGIWILALSLSFAVAGAWLMGKFLQNYTLVDGLQPIILSVAVQCVILLFVLRFLTDLILDAVFVRHRFNQTSIRVSGRSRPTLIAIGLAATLCGAICVPTAFMVAEFGRHVRIPVGYETANLYASHLVLLDHDQRDQKQWWEQLDALRNDVAQISGVLAAGYITPAPWDFAGTKSVVSNEEDMLLNIAITKGVLPMLSPSGWKGREIFDQENMAEVILQDIDEATRRNFIPVGTTVIDEIRGFRYSPLDEIGRPAILRSLRAGIGYDVSFVVKAHSSAAGISDSLNTMMANHGEIFAASPFMSVEQILIDRLSSVRISAVISTAVATIAVFLLVVTLLAAIRLYVTLNRRNLSIRLCLGAQFTRVQTALVVRSLIVIGVGWALGTMVGLALWHQIVFLIRDHRLVQPWSSSWLLLAALLLIAPYGWYMTRASLQRISISEALKA